MAIISNGTTIITGGSLTDGIVVAGDLASNSVTSAKIASSAVTDAKISGMSSSKLSGALPAIDGSALTNLPGGGKVLQVIGANDSTTRSTNSTSFTDASSTLTATITPSSTSSKVLIMMSIGTYKKAGGVQFITIYRGSTNLANNDGFVANNGVNNNYSTAVVHLDSPNTTSATTYEFRMRSESSGDTQNINGQGGKSSFIVMEIGA